MFNLSKYLCLVKYYLYMYKCTFVCRKKVCKIFPFSLSYFRIAGIESCTIYIESVSHLTPKALVWVCYRVNKRISIFHSSWFNSYFHILNVHTHIHMCICKYSYITHTMVTMKPFNICHIFTYISYEYVCWNSEFCNCWKYVDDTLNLIFNIFE